MFPRAQLTLFQAIHNPKVDILKWIFLAVMPHPCKAPGRFTLILITSSSVSRSGDQHTPVQIPEMLTRLFIQASLSILSSIKGI